MYDQMSYSIYSTILRIERNVKTVLFSAILVVGARVVMIVGKVQYAVLRILPNSI